MSPARTQTLDSPRGGRDTPRNFNPRREGCARGLRATMRRAAALLAQRLPAAVEAAQPSTSAAAVQWSRAFSSTAAPQAPVHIEEEVYNRRAALLRSLVGAHRGHRTRDGARQGHLLSGQRRRRSRCSPLHAAHRFASLAGNGSSSSWATGCPPRPLIRGWRPMRWWSAMWTCLSRWGSFPCFAACMARCGWGRTYLHSRTPLARYRACWSAA